MPIRKLPRLVPLIFQSTSPLLTKLTNDIDFGHGVCQGKHLIDVLTTRKL